MFVNELLEMKAVITPSVGAGAFFSIFCIILNETKNPLQWFAFPIEGIKHMTIGLHCALGSRHNGWWAHTFKQAGHTLFFLPFVNGDSERASIGIQLQMKFTNVIQATSAMVFHCSSCRRIMTPKLVTFLTVSVSKHDDGVAFKNCQTGEGGCWKERWGDREWRAQVLAQEESKALMLASKRSDRSEWRRQKGRSPCRCHKVRSV